MSRLCLKFCWFEGDGLLATKTCFDCEHDKIRHLEIVDVLIHAYGFWWVGRVHPFLERWLGQSGWKAVGSGQGDCAGTRLEALVTAAGFKASGDE